MNEEKKPKKRLYIFGCESDDEGCCMAYVATSFKRALSMARNLEWADWYDTKFDFWCDLKWKRRKDIDASWLEYGEVWLEIWMKLWIYTWEL